MTSRFEPIDDNLFEDQAGVLVPRSGSVTHQADEYDPAGFAVLLRMQREHFWYRGRHRFVRAALQISLKRAGAKPHRLSAIDIGGGCGGWVAYLSRKGPAFRELALADSSLAALRLARTAVPGSVRCYQVSLHDLPSVPRWDVVFLLDVLEHLSDDAGALRQIAKWLKPGGFVIATVPALMAFWSQVDEVGGHRRRYSREGLAQLGVRAGFEIADARYFMFLLSPMLWASRRAAASQGALTSRQIREMVEKTHRVPPFPLNRILSAVFAAETPAGLHLRFPWGTSALAVFRHRT